MLPHAAARDEPASPRASGPRRWLARLAPALIGIAAFAISARVVDPGLRVETAGPLAPAEEADVRATLERYQEIYEDFFASGGGPAMLDAFPASKTVKHHIFRDIGFVRDAGLVFVQDLATSSVRGMRRASGGLVEADVYEEWNHVLQSRADRTPVTPVKGLGQGFRYFVRRERSGWQVVDWDIVDLPAPERSGERTW